jgi:sugar lactone lactonase YvrE
MIRTSVLLSATPLFLAMLLTGCGMGPSSADPVATRGVALQGIVHGGQQPVVGSQIELFAAGTTGNGTSATALLQDPVFTDAGGNWSITGDYKCPDASTEVYLMALGGNPGLGAGTNNSAITLVAALGQCGNLTPNTFVIINEVTTVATAYALAGFIGDGEAIGSSSTNAVGLQNAFATVNNLVDINSGMARSVTPGGQGIVPLEEINSLADALATCVNNASDSSPACIYLFDSAVDTFGDDPADAFGAAINLAHNPAQPGGSLALELVSATAPFQPTLSAEPTDYSMGIVYYGGGLSYPYSLAIDGLGNAWVSSQPDYGGNLSELSPQGVPISPAPNGFDIGYVVPGPIAIDSKNNIWMPNMDPGNGSVIEVDNNGTPLSPDSASNGTAGFLPGSLLFPQSIAIDFHDDVWISNGNGVLVEVSNAGTLLSPSAPPAGFSSPGYAIAATSQASAAGLAIDSSDNIWVANAGQDSLVEMNLDGFIMTPPPQGIYGGGLDGVTNGTNPPSAVALDPLTLNIYTLNSDSGTLSRFSPTNRTANSPTDGFSVGGNPVAFCIDSDENMYISQPNNNLIEIVPATNPDTATTSGTIYNPGVNGPAGIVIDASGNLWIANFGSGFRGTVTELVGIGAPTKTPLAVANQTPFFEP